MPELKSLSISLWLFIIISTSSCGAVPVGDVVADFDAGVQQSSSAVRKFYLDLNAFERHLFFEGLIFRGGDMAAKRDGKNTGMLARFSEDDIQARMIALSAIGNYSKGLVQLASPERAKQAEKSITSIGLSLGAINTEISSLVGADNATLSKIAGPIGALAGMAAKYWGGRQREKALKASIEQGAPEVEKIFDLLEQDVSEVMAGIYKNGAQGNLLDYTNYYNNHLQNSGKVDADRIAFLQSANDAADRYAHLSSADPSALLKKMRKVHRDIVTWAQQKNAKPETIDGLLSDLQSFLNETAKATNNLSLINKNIR